MTATFHPDDDLLLAYAAGNLGEEMALLVATHLALCPHCRAEVGKAEAVGGAILDDLAPMTMGGNALQSVLARLGDPAPAPKPKPASPPPLSFGGAAIPRPLRDYLPASLDSLPWQRQGSGIKQAVLLGGQGAKARLFLISGGTKVPRHTHEGSELTLVLSGAFSDYRAHYKRGDVAQADGEIDHSPVADKDQDCLCLSVTDARLRLTGLIGRLVDPFLDI